MQRYQFLLVDDSKLAREVVMAILADYPCDFSVAESGEQALEECNQVHFDLIIMDLSLPRHNGFEVAELIRNHSLINKKTPIVALSVHNESYFTTQIQKNHLNGFITKPLTREKAGELMSRFEQGML